jgi:uncharacterized LabA/DUF88 family protein
MRTYIYIDGFNLYYGVIKNTNFKWLDLKKLCQNLLKPDYNIVTIKYFTARVSGKYDQSKPQRQDTYLKALKSFIPEIEIHYGVFRSHPAKAPLYNPRNSQLKLVDIIKTEEKGTDVKLATHLLNDAWNDLYDCAILISNDSDISESLKLVKKQFSSKKIGLFIPDDAYPSNELKANVDFIKRIRKGAISLSQLPNPIPNTNIYKPKLW